MEKLVINVPEVRSNIVKRVLHGLGVNIEGVQSAPKSNYSKKLANISTWTDEDIKLIEQGSNFLNNFKAEEW